MIYQVAPGVIDELGDSPADWKGNGQTIGCRSAAGQTIGSKSAIRQTIGCRAAAGQTIGSAVGHPVAWGSLTD